MCGCNDELTIAPKASGCDISAEELKEWMHVMSEIVRQDRIHEIQMQRSDFNRWYGRVIVAATSQNDIGSMCERLREFQQLFPLIKSAVAL